MLLDILKQFNWLDVFIVILLIRICYIAFSSGFTIEFFKLVGTLAAIYLPMHYYTQLSDWAVRFLPLPKDNVPLEFIDFVCFLLLAVTGYCIFMAVRVVFYRFIQLKAVPNLNMWGGLILGAARGFLLAGLITFMLVISSISYLKKSAINSYSSKYLLNVAPGTYSFLWKGLFSKFMTSEEENKTVLEIQGSIK